MDGTIIPKFLGRLDWSLIVTAGARADYRAFLRFPEAQM